MIVPKHGDLGRKDEGWLASQGFLGPTCFYMLCDQHIFICFFTYDIFWWAVLKGSG